MATQAPFQEATTNPSVRSRQILKQRNEYISFQMEIQY